MILDKSNAPKPFASELEKRHYLSTPRTQVGEALRGIASAAIDISDGVISDLGHILKRSGVGAQVEVERLPLSQPLLEFVGSPQQAQQYALTSGEEYELCFTVPESREDAMWQALQDIDCQITRIGTINDDDKLRLTLDGQDLAWQLSGYDHFKTN